MKRSSAFWLVPVFGSVLMSVGCAHSVIPNTAIPDNPENRELIAVLERYRSAVEQRDVGVLTAMASVDYFDDMGTAIGNDDIDYKELKSGLARVREEVLAARYNVSYRGITSVGDRVWVDILYSAWFKVREGEGEPPVWKRRLQPHRIALAREKGQYKIVSGI